MPIRAVIFDLGGTLMEWPEWMERAPEKWRASYSYLVAARPGKWPNETEFVAAMRAAELEHWRLVDEAQASTTPLGLVREGFRRLAIEPTEDAALAVLDGYAASATGWAEVYPTSATTLLALRGAKYRLGLLSNTWWAAAWHDADLAAHGLGDLFDVVVYTSDLPRSKPHPSAFRHVARRLDVAPEECVMIGDRLIDDVGGALGVGMRGIWRRNATTPTRDDIDPTAVIEGVEEVPAILRRWADLSG